MKEKKLLIFSFKRDLILEHISKLDGTDEVHRRVTLFKTFQENQCCLLPPCSKTIRITLLEKILPFFPVNTLMYRVAKYRISSSLLHFNID